MGKFSPQFITWPPAHSSSSTGSPAAAEPTATQRRCLVRGCVSDPEIEGSRAHEVIYADVCWAIPPLYVVGFLFRYCTVLVRRGHGVIYRAGEYLLRRLNDAGKTMRRQMTTHNPSRVTIRRPRPQEVNLIASVHREGNVGNVFNVSPPTEM